MQLFVVMMRKWRWIYSIEIGKNRGECSPTSPPHQFPNLTKCIEIRLASLTRRELELRAGLDWDWTVMRAEKEKKKGEEMYVWR